MNKIVNVEFEPCQGWPIASVANWMDSDKPETSKTFVVVNGMLDTEATGEMELPTKVTGYVTFTFGHGWNGSEQIQDNQAVVEQFFKNLD